MSFFTPEEHAKHEAELEVKFNKIIDKLRPGTLESERISIIACMSSAGEAVAELIFQLMKDHDPGP